MGRPTFNIADLIAPVGRALAYPFGLSTPTQQAAKPTPTPSTGTSYEGLRAIDIQSPRVRRQLSGEEPLP